MATFASTGSGQLYGVHKKIGNVVMADGHVEAVASKKKSGHVYQVCYDYTGVLSKIGETGAADSVTGTSYFAGRGKKRTTQLH